MGRHGHIIFYLIIAKYDSDTKSFQTAYTFYVHYKNLTFSVTLKRGDYIVYLLLSANWRGYPFQTVLKVMSSKIFTMESLRKDENCNVIHSITNDIYKTEFKHELNKEIEIVQEKLFFSVFKYYLFIL